MQPRFDLPSWAAHEEVVLGFDPVTGLRAIMAVHSTVRGPALGGTRWYPYRDDLAALEDVLRLSQAMSLKAAAAGLALGGGKAVIIGDPERDRSASLLASYGRMVGRLGGRYITAEDIGTTVDDMASIRTVTEHVVGLPAEIGGLGDPSPATARGVHVAIRSVARRLWGSPELSGRRVVVVGVGKVGSALVEHLVRDGCEVIVSDVNPVAVDRVRQRYDVTVVSPDDAFSVPCDIVSPAALGGSLNGRTIEMLRCAAIVGAANNQLADPSRDAELLRARGILYAPDFVVNAGGLIYSSHEVHGGTVDDALRAVTQLGDSVGLILDLAAQQGISTHEAAARLARERIASSSRWSPDVI